MWLTATYRPTTLFSLKASSATSSGGKSLLAPTPFAVKMALLDSAFRLWGVGEARRRWPTIRDRTVAVAVPERAVVTNLFQKVLKPRRNPAAPGTRHAGPLQQTIAFREYVFYAGDLGLAIDIPPDKGVGWLGDLLLQINSLGKRGSFLQLAAPPQMFEELPATFVVVDGALPASFDLNSTLQQLDDCTPQLSFDKANIYSGQRITLGRDRVLHPVFLPYKIIRTSKTFTSYDRADL
ncbi:MAG TPA: hypothetical protein DEP84_33825 [Chloroflexi bacterium]|nr:hypothetical protein [Chloroflexota bacterium]